MRCNECGAPYTGYLQKQKNLYYYRCRTKGCCNNRSRKQLHSTFAEHLERYELNPQILEHVRQMMRYVFKKYNQDMLAEAKTYKQELVFPEGISYDRENERVLTDRINCLFLPIPELVRNSGNKKTGSSEKYSFDPVMSGRQDLNLRPLVPHTSTLPDCATPRILTTQNRQLLDSLQKSGLQFSVNILQIDLQKP